MGQDTVTFPYKKKGDQKLSKHIFFASFWLALSVQFMIAEVKENQTSQIKLCSCPHNNPSSRVSLASDMLH